MSFQGRELEYLVHPTSVTDFVRDYWDKKPLYIAGKPEKYADIYDLECWAKARRFRELVAATIDDRGLQQEYRIEPALIEPLYKAGLTICADVSDDPKLAPFLSGFCERLKIAGGPGFAKLYASANERGFAIHTDKFHVFVLQISGSKLWRYSRAPAVPSANVGGMMNENGIPVFVFPDTGSRMMANQDTPAEEAKVDELESVVLKPGDLLYLPPGTWHQGRAIDHSIAVSISPPRVTVAQLMLKVIEDTLLQRPEWRQDVLGAGDERPEPGKIQPRVAELFGARTKDLASLLGKVDQRVFHRAWALNVSLGSISTEPEPPGDPIPAENDIGRGQRIVHRDGEPLSYLVVPTPSGKDEVLMYHRGSEWALPIEAAEFIAELMKHREFVAEAATKWDPKLGWEDVRSILHQLLQAGLLRCRGRR
jgi:hypothetical protein